MRKITRFTLAIYAWLLVIYLLVPALIIVPTSLSAGTSIQFPPQNLTLYWYTVVAEGAWLNSAIISGSISVMAATIGVTSGFCIALAQFRIGSLSKGMRGVLALPILVPHIILGSGLFACMLILGVNFESRWPLALVYGAISVPVVMSVLLPVFQMIDPLIWSAAGSLGASPWVATRKVMVPLVAPAALVAFLLAFSVAWDETTLAIFIGPSIHPTLSVRMFSYLQQNVTPEIAAVSTLLLLITAIVAILTAFISRNGRR